MTSRSPLILVCPFLLLPLLPLHAQSLDPVADSLDAMGNNTFVKLLYVAPNGSDSSPGTEGRPFRTIRRAVDAAVPGTKIFLKTGTYREVVQPKATGRPGFPIVLRPYGNGEVTIAPNLRKVGCGGLSPTRERAIRLVGGLDNWRIRGLTIVGGILVSGESKRNLEPYVWDRTLPGRGLYDPEAAKHTLETLGADGSDNIEIWQNKIVGRGIYTHQSRWGSILNNEVANIDCGTGGGMWIGRFSDGWTIRDNWVHDIQASVEHALTEGIRIVGASMYNLIERNLVEDVAGDGRGFASDANAGWNVFQENTSRNAAKGFNEETGGWGNAWLSNVAESSREGGYAIDVKDNDRNWPDDGVPAYTKFQCNVATRGGDADLIIGAVQNGTFKNNAMPRVKLFDNVERYWDDVGNTWDGSSQPPPPRPPQKRC